MTLRKINKPLILAALASVVFLIIFSIKPALSITSSKYLLKGTRDGSVTVSEKATGKIAKTFSMKPGVVVREIGWVDGGKTLFASQKSQTVFWDFETGREIKRFNKRIYLFSHDEKSFVTFSKKPESLIEIHSYPSMASKAVLEGVKGMGPSAMAFSPNDRYLLVQFNNFYPAPDAQYPCPEMGKSLYEMRLYDIRTGRRIVEFEKGNPAAHLVGIFSDDSRYYYPGTVAGGKEAIDYSQKFDLSSLRWIK